MPESLPGRRAVGLPLDAAARYVGRSMPLRRSMKRSLSISLWLAVLVCLRSGAREQGTGAQNPDEGQFQVLLKQGFDFHRQARFAEGIPVLERARKLEPRDYFANLLLGIDLLRTGKPLDAIPRLELAARTRTAEETPEDYLGEAHAGLGQYA